MNFLTSIILINLVNTEISGEERKKDDRTPLDRLNRLRSFHTAWVSAWLVRNQIDHWQAKFDRNANRLETRYSICGDPSAMNEEKEERKRRSTTGDAVGSNFNDKLAVDISDSSLRISDDPLEAIKQITGGYARWAQKYIADCKHQPLVQEKRADIWLKSLRKRFAKNHPDYEA